MFKTKTKSRLKRMLSGALALAMTASAAAVMPASAEETAKWFCQYHLTHFIRTRIMQ